MLNIYSLEQSEQWDAVVRSFEHYDVYWLSGYVKAFKIHGDGGPHLFYYEGSDIRGINVVMKRDIEKDARFIGKIEENTWFDFVTPYGYGGWLIEGDGDSFELFIAYQAWCHNHNVVSEFVRYHPVLENYKYSESFYDVLALGNTITMDLSSPETIWSNLTSKNRNMVRKAQKSGIVIYNGRYPEIFEIFREIYNRTMDKDGAEAYYYFSAQFYESVLNDLPQNSQVFYAVLEGKVIASSIMLFANGRMNYHLSGSIKEYAHLAPTNLILYEAALWGYASGCKTLYLGGGVGSGEDSLYNFKKAFFHGDGLNRFHIGKKIYIQAKYDELVGMREEINNGFFPKYRA